MEFDFAAVLLALTVFTGVVWAVDALFFRKARVARAAAAGEKPHEPTLVDYSRSLFPVILAVLIFRSFIAEPFRIPSGSMMPTLRVGDFILVNKFAYGLRLPAFNTKILDTGEPRRGDVVVFRFPLDPKQDYIKRVIGLPGDTVTVRNEQVFINGKPIATTLVGPYDDGSGKESTLVEANAGQLYRENLGRVQNDVIEMPDLSRAPQGSWKVPPHCYFAMGDNRDNSYDSRFWGCVPEQNLVGRAFLIWFSWRGESRGIDFKRIGTIIH